MAFDEKVPLLLKREQQWFGSMISRPINENSQMDPISPSGRLMEEEAADYIAPSPTLRPAQRIQIYHQQYWWRLLNTLHESFPLVTRLFGYSDFNRQIGIPYLTKYPPRHWSLALLGDRLLKWCDEEYQATDKQLVLEAIKLDWAFLCAFTIGSVASLTLEQLSVQENQTAIFDKPLYLQPFIYFFEFEYDLFTYRTDFLKHDPDYWLDHDFPFLDRSERYYYLLYRNQKNDISWKKVLSEEYLTLHCFQKGESIENLCEWLEGQEQSFYQTAADHLQLWFQEWGQRGWLSLQDPNNLLTSHVSAQTDCIFQAQNSFI